VKVKIKMIKTNAQLLIFTWDKTCALLQELFFQTWVILSVSRTHYCIKPPPIMFVNTIHIMSQKEAATTT